MASCCSPFVAMILLCFRVGVCACDAASMLFFAEMVLGSGWRDSCYYSS